MHFSEIKLIWADGMLEKSIQGRMIFRYQPHPSLPQKSGFSKKLMLEWDIFKSQKSVAVAI